MTRPSDVKPREGAQPGTPYAAFEPGAALPELRFEVTPEIVAEYRQAVSAEPDGFRIDGRLAASPTVLMPYLAAIIYRRYPPIQGIIMIEVKFATHHPLWADETTSVRASGRVLEKFEKRGRFYIRWEGAFHRADGQPLASFVNLFSVPE